MCGGRGRCGGSGGPGGLRRALSRSWSLESLRSATAGLSLIAIPDGVLDTAIRADEAGSEEDLYEDMHSSSHHYSHPGGGGEQLAINERRA
ncbi:Rho guanine nucleotide exchange factor 4 [Vulpes lagopus]